MSPDEESVWAEGQVGERLEETRVRGAHGTTALADGMVVVADGEAEPRSPVHIKPLHDPGRPEPLENPVHRHLSQRGRVFAGALPDLLTGRDVRPRRQRP